jgi:DNA repair exonuclease SbcCD ATPase subunit
VKDSCGIPPTEECVGDNVRSQDEEELKEDIEEITRDIVDDQNIRGLDDIVKFVILRKNKEWEVVVDAVETRARNELLDVKDEHEDQLKDLREEIEAQKPEILTASIAAMDNEILQLRDAIKQEEATSNSWVEKVQNLSDQVEELENRLKNASAEPDVHYEREIQRVVSDALTWKERALSCRAQRNEIAEQYKFFQAAFEQTKKNLDEEIKKHTEIKSEYAEFLEAKARLDSGLEDQVKDLRRHLEAKDEELKSLRCENDEVWKNYEGITTCLPPILKFRRPRLSKNLSATLNLLAFLRSRKSLRRPKQSKSET